MLIRSRPQKTSCVISRGTSVWVGVVSFVITIGFVAIGATNYALQAGAFPIVYFCLRVVASHQVASATSRYSPIPERPWATVPISVFIAFAWGLVLLSLYFFMVMAMIPQFMHDFVRTPSNSILTIRNTELLISTLLSIYVLLDYARLASVARCNLGHQAIATALALEFLLATHFAVY